MTHTISKQAARVALFQVELKCVTSFHGIGLANPITCKFQSGRMFSIVGDSGVGKSTLLKIVAGVVKPQRGAVDVGGHRVPLESSSDHVGFCRDRIVMIFQEQNLIEHLTVLQNVALPLWINKRGREPEADKEAKRHLEDVGMLEKAPQLVQSLSGGERQRVAIARAMISKAPLVLADEPTEGLDPQRCVEVMRLLRFMARKQGKTVIVVTHNHEIAHRYSDRVLELSQVGLRIVKRPVRTQQPALKSSGGDYRGPEGNLESSTAEADSITERRQELYKHLASDNAQERLEALRELTKIAKQEIMTGRPA